MKKFSVAALALFALSGCLDPAEITVKDGVYSGMVFPDVGGLNEVEAPVFLALPLSVDFKKCEVSINGDTQRHGERGYAMYCEGGKVYQTGYGGFDSPIPSRSEVVKPENLKVSVSNKRFIIHGEKNLTLTHPSFIKLLLIKHLVKV